MPSRPIRLSRSTSATSPSRAAPSSSAARPAKDLAAFLGGDLDGAALLEAHDEPLDDRPVEQRERPRGRDDPLGACGIGRGEHLLGGEVRHVADAVHRLAACGLPSGVRKKADDEIRARPLEVERVEPGPLEPPRDVVQLFPSRRPGRDRVRLVEAAHVRDLVPQAFEGLRPRQVGVDELCPLEGRRRDDRPVDETLVDDREHLLDERQLVAAGAIGVEPCERVGRPWAGEGYPRRPLPAELEHPVAEPAGNEVECLRARMLDPRALRIRVEVRDVHEARTSRYAAAATSRAISSWPREAPTVTSWSSWTFAPSTTASSASRDAGACGGHGGRV